MISRDKNFSSLPKLQQIRIRESELHTGRQTKSGKPKPDLLGYEDEDLMLSDFMTYLSNEMKHKNPELDKTIFHIENEGNSGGKMGAIAGAISKGKGKKKGVLDVESVYLGITNWMEFKLADGEFSDEQLDFIRLVVGWGQAVFIIRNFDFFWWVVIEVILAGKKVKGGVYTAKFEL